MHVTPTVHSLVPVYKGDVVFLKVQAENLAVVPCPFHTARIAKDVKTGGGNRLLDVFHGTLKIAAIIAVEVVTEHVATSGMDGDRRA